MPNFIDVMDKLVVLEKSIDDMKRQQALISESIIVNRIAMNIITEDIEKMSEDKHND